MSTFPLKIVTPDGPVYDGEARMLVVRTVTGDLAVMAKHINCVAPLGMGRATVMDADGSRRYGACIGGILSVHEGQVNLVPTTFEWAESIDTARARLSLERAEKVLGSKDASPADLKLAEARLRRALVRKSVAAQR